MSTTNPPVLWRPTPESVAGTDLAGFIKMLRTRTGLPLADYDAVWEYSTQNLTGFWSAVADHYDVRWRSRPSLVIDNTMMPGTNRFPGGTLNYAEHATTTRRW